MSLTVVCLCAEWCNTCGSYRSTFDAQAQRQPADRFVWLDIEEHEALLGDLDITNFPTLLLLDDTGQALFAGTVTPQAETLLRLCQAADSGSLTPRAVERQWQDVARHLHKP